MWPGLLGLPSSFWQRASYSTAMRYGEAGLDVPLCYQIRQSFRPGEITLKKQTTAMNWLCAGSMAATKAFISQITQYWIFTVTFITPDRLQLYPNVPALPLWRGSTVCVWKWAWRGNPKPEARESTGIMNGRKTGTACLIFKEINCGWWQCTGETALEQFFFSWWTGG